MEKKKVYHITEHQAGILIKEELNNPELMKYIGEKPNRSAHPYPISTGKFDEENAGGVGVGVGANKEEEPQVDLKSLPKPQEIKEAWKLLRQASALLVQGAPKLQEENLSKSIQKMAKDINDLVMKANAELNINEIDLTT